MSKIVIDLLVKACEKLTPQHALITLSSPDMPTPTPGQFVMIRIAGAGGVMLRRPISIHSFNGRDEIQLLVHNVGEGTKQLCNLQIGDQLDCLLPLGRGYTLPDKPGKALLVGGGVGIAPLLFLAQQLCAQGTQVNFILGGKSSNDILNLNAFEQYGRVHLTTEDGSAGIRGFVTQHPVFEEDFTQIYTCGPSPMMKAVARLASTKQTPCQVSLENMMACGLGACLCCVEKTSSGNVQVCTKGPVFDTKDLLW